MIIEDYLDQIIDATNRTNIQICDGYKTVEAFIRANGKPFHTKKLCPKGHEVLKKPTG